MAIVSRFSVEKAKSFKKAVKQGLTQRIRQSVGISDDSSSSSESEDSEDDTASTGTRVHHNTDPDSQTDQDATLRGKPVLEDDQDDGGNPETGFSKHRFRLRRKKDRKRRRKARGEKAKQGDIEAGEVPRDTNKKNGGFGLSSKEQNTPADAVLAEENANEVCLVFSPPSHQKLTPCP